MAWSPQANWMARTQPVTQTPPQTQPQQTPQQTPQTLGTNSGALGQWNPWMTSGGVNPGGWQSFGGPSNTGFLGMTNWSQGASDPGHATPTDPQSGFQSFIDNSYDQSTRQLDPQFAQAKSSFDQDMVNRGLAPGSAAYDSAMADFDRSKNDAYAQARNQAQQTGLAAQNQAFGQGVQQSQLSGALAQALIGANSNYLGNQMSGNASLMNALLGGNQGIAQSLIGADASRFGATASANASRHGSDNNFNLGMAGLNQQGQQQDFGNLMQLLNLGQGTTQYNNGLLSQDQARNMQFWGGMPGAGTGNIDVQNPYNNQYNGQMNGWNYQNQQANAQNQNYAQWASILASMYGGG